MLIIVVHAIGQNVENQYKSVMISELGHINPHSLRMHPRALYLVSVAICKSKVSKVPVLSLVSTWHTQPFLVAASSHGT